MFILTLIYMAQGKKNNFSSVMQERLCALTEALNVSNREFSKRIGKSDNYIATINKDITVGVANNILTAFPNINLYWLVTGEGKILMEKPLSQELSNYLDEQNKALKKENRELLIEIGKLQALLEEREKTIVQLGGDAACVGANQLSLAK